MIIEVQDLKKSYGKLEVLKGISFSVGQGEIFAILGPNGAGKTTCVEILEGYRDYDSGQISILGYDPAMSAREFKERIGIVVQTSGIENELTAREAIKLYSSPYKSCRTPEELLALVKLEEKADVRVSKLSGGQKRKLDLVLGLVGDPDLIFLDEPTTGFSPEARREAWDILDNLRNLGKTILLTSHYMEEVERLADRMVILSGGKIIQEGVPQDLRQGMTSVSFALPEVWNRAELESWLRQGTIKELVEELEINSQEVSFMTSAPTEILGQIIQKAQSDSLELENLSVHLLNLEDIYLNAIGQNPTISIDSPTNSPSDSTSDSPNSMEMEKEPRS